MNKIKKIKLFCNNNEKSIETKKSLEEKLISNDFEIVKKDFDLGIAIGGDGAFLRMVKEEAFSSDVYFVGINTGTLGFLQEIKESDIDSFISYLKKDEYKIETIGIQETMIESDDEEYKFYSLNEIVIREKDLNTVNLLIKVNGNLLETFVGDGVLISTSVGSTAYNLSFGGSIINGLHTLQITPIAPLNSKAYRSLINPIIIPEKNFITIEPINNKNNLILSIDGDNLIVDNTKVIITGVLDKRIYVLRLKNYNFYEKLNEKFLI